MKSVDGGSCPEKEVRNYLIKQHSTLHRDRASSWEAHPPRNKPGMKLRGPRLKALDVLHASGAVRFSPFLCPALAGPTLSKSTARQSKCFSSFYRLFSQAAVTPVQNQQVSATPARNGINEDLLPLCCPGCGALSQTVNAEQAGYYDLERSAVRKYLKHGIRETQSENATFSEAIYNANSGVLRQLGLERATSGGASLRT